MTELQPYLEYTASEVEWLDTVPATWTMHKLGSLFDLQRRDVRYGDEIVTAFRDGEVTLRRHRRLEGYTEADKEIGYQGVRPGDLVIHNMDGFAGAIGVSDASGKSTPVYSIATPRPGQSAHFFAHLLRHLARTGFITAMARGIRERSTDFRWASAREVLVPVPDRKTQDAIVAFLDREIAEINAFIADQEELIGLLSERRAATIAHAVTKGLDPSVAMKESGVQWLGAVPVHWRIGRVGFGYRLTLGKMVNAKVTEGELRPYLRAGNIQDHGVDLSEVKTMPITDVEANALTLRANDVVVVEGGAGYGRSDVLAQDLEGWAFQNHVIRARPTIAQDSRFLDYTIKSLRARGHFEALGAYATIPNLSSEKLATIEFPFFPAAEQAQIADFLDRETGELGAAISDAREAIALSKERRAALISAAVTGKIDVRSAS